VATEAAAADKKSELRPASIRPSRIPVPPPWNTVRVFLDNVATGERDPKIASEKNTIDDNSSSDTRCGRSDRVSLFCQGNSFDRIVART